MVQRFLLAFAIFSGLWVVAAVHAGGSDSSLVGSKPPYACFSLQQLRFGFASFAFTDDAFPHHHNDYSSRHREMVQSGEIRKVAKRFES